MKKIIIDFKNCYGIRKLEYEFNFTASNLFVVYAPNGAMKTSFANAFKDLSEDKASEDRIFKDRETKRTIKNEKRIDLSKEQVFVIEPYNPEYKSSKISTLLVNKALKEKYDKIYEEIDERKEILIKELKPSSGLKNNLEQVIANDFTHDPKEFFTSLMRVQQEVLAAKKSFLADITYQKIFNDKVLAYLGSPDFKQKFSQYMKTYDDIISKSTFFKKGIFNHNNATDIAKSLKENGFFKANHSVYIQVENVKKEIKTDVELEKAIQQEKDSILQNPALAKSFEEIDKILVKNKESKDFREYLDKNKAILPELENLDSLRQKLWIAYFTKSIDAYRGLMDVFIKGKEEIEKIVAQAKKEATKWADVIAIFNKRFSVPFEVLMANQDDVILKSEAPSINFSGYGRYVL